MRNRLWEGTATRTFPLSAKHHLPRHLPKFHSHLGNDQAVSQSHAFPFPRLLDFILHQTRLQQQLLCSHSHPDQTPYLVDHLGAGYLQSPGLSIPSSCLFTCPVTFIPSGNINFTS